MATCSEFFLNKKSISFDAALNWEDEDRRTAHGVEVRRERKQRKKERKRVRAEEARRVLETFAILRETGRLQAVVAVWSNIPYPYLGSTIGRISRSQQSVSAS
jgi:hypothetical protein